MLKLKIQLPHNDPLIQGYFIQPMAHSTQDRVCLTNVLRDHQIHVTKQTPKKADKQDEGPDGD
jgi:hypothetical protein